MMTHKEEIEVQTKAVLSEKNLDWIVAFVEENKAAGLWEIELEVPNGPELILSIPLGSKQQMKMFLEQQVEEEMQRVKMHCETAAV